MPRKPKEPIYFESRGGWFIQLHKKQICLAKGPKHDPEVKKEAERRFHELMLASQVEAAGDQNACYGVLNAFIVWVRDNRATNTYKQYKAVIQAFIDKYPKLRVKEITPYHVEMWLSEKQTPWHDERRKKWERWGQGTRRLAITTLIAGFNWAKKRKLISSNPLEKMERPRARSRGRENLISEQQHRLLLAYADRWKNKSFRNLLIALNGTGARPGEITGVTAPEFNEKIGAWVIGTDRHEAEGKNKLAWRGTVRVVYLTDDLIELVKQLNQQYPKGPIFRNHDGNAWSELGVAQRFRRARNAINREARQRGDEPPLGKISPYSYRHKFATEWLLAGKPVGYLCELLCTSMAMIEKHYGHLKEHTGALRAALLEFRQAPATSVPTQGEKRG